MRVEDINGMPKEVYRFLGIVNDKLYCYLEGCPEGGPKSPMDINILNIGKISWMVEFFAANLIYEVAELDDEIIETYVKSLVSGIEDRLIKAFKTTKSRVKADELKDFLNDSGHPDLAKELDNLF